MDPKIEAYGMQIAEYAAQNYQKCLREPEGILQHPFIVPGSCYASELWDWDCWLTNLALRSITDAQSIAPYEKGCVLNFLEHTDAEGRMPIFVTPRKTAMTAFGPGEKIYTSHVWHSTHYLSQSRAGMQNGCVSTFLVLSATSVGMIGSVCMNPGSMYGWMILLLAWTMTPAHFTVLRRVLAQFI